MYAIRSYYGHDANNNGAMDAGEKGMSGLTVVLTGDFNFDGTATETLTTKTVSGVYLFTGLPAGEYVITSYSIHYTKLYDLIYH